MKYILRAVKYLIKIALLLALIFALMQWGGMSNIETGGAEGGGILGFFKSFIATTRGQVFSVVLLIWCAIYPAVEFKRRQLFYTLDGHKAAVIKALNAGGMTLASETDGQLVFHGSPLRRIWWMGDDTVTITRNAAGGIDIEGPRRFVMEAQHRIPNYVGIEN